MSLLEARAVCRSFGSVLALDHVDVRLDEGERLGLIGPNGSGKTTLFNVVSGYLPPSAGTISLRGKNITKSSMEATARYGLVRTFQHDAVFPGLTVEENIRLPVRRRLEHGSGVPSDVAAIIALAGLDAVAGERASQLSYGHRRRLGVAIAAATNPYVMLLDEPAAGLNDNETADLASMLESIHGMGVTLMVIEHDMTFVSSLCTRTIVLNVGAVIAEGSPTEVRRDPAVAKAYLGETLADRM